MSKDDVSANHVIPRNRYKFDSCNRYKIKYSERLQNGMIIN